MPHLVLECTANVPDMLEPAELLGRLHEALLSCGPFEPASIKSRVVPREIYRVADGAPDRAFVHLQVGLLEGRDTETLRRVGAALLAVLCEAFPRARAERRCDITVEIRELKPALYFKAVAR